MHCPTCHSTNIKTKNYRGTTVLICDDCGFDERNELDISPEERTNQKAKSEYSPYKIGGKNRNK